MVLKLSIIIPTLNEEHYVGELLDCLMCQTSADFEVVVVDAGSDDRTREVVELRVAKAAKVLISFYQPGIRGVSAQRNYGAEVAKADRLLFLDADVQVKEKFIEKCLEEIEKRKLILASCHFEPMSTRVDDKVLYSLASAYIATMQFLEPVSMGWCIFSSKQVHKKLNGFSESLRFGEDYDYIQRAADMGFNFKLLTSGKVYISVRRLDDEGRLTYYKKAVLSEMNRLVSGKVEDQPFDYEFGKFREDLSAKKYHGNKEFWKKVFAAIKEPFKI